MYCSSMAITNFLPRDTKLVNSTMHVELVASAYVCFPNKADKAVSEIAK